MTRPLLEVEDVWRDYHRGSETIHALRGVSFSVDTGEIVGIVGRSGSGKTTLLNQIAGLDTPTRGTIHLAGREITSMSERALVTVRRDLLGVIFQLFYLIPTLTALENVELPLIFARTPDRHARALAALRRVGMTETQARPAQMDGGDLQRVAIARALAHSPKLLLADEPTGRLDGGERGKMLDIFRQLAKEGLGILLVTHDPALALETDRVIELVDGGICR